MNNVETYYSGNRATKGYSIIHYCRSSGILPDISFGNLAIYTGTFTWINPAVGLNYVFLRKRVYPTRNNNKISELDIRTGVADAFYKAIRRGI
ncbi:hypothetical protein [Fibrella aquatilis]|uniref:Uncharacterized protein n=1 Tax=Fibrella aquatilis TaxID=2817059 RepID=A0A939G581_9BACT|nr:hypothetical protein [Fibrella aquatilis]MBO0930018.1 hypothetical protein [Fibrella aquatilis]